LLQTTRRIRQFSSGREPKPTDKVVYVDGSFDLLHIGHVRILKKARELGDFVLVGIHDDDTVRALKGDGYPALLLQERLLNLCALKYVDEVLIGAPWKVSDQIIKAFNIQIVLEGSAGSGTVDETLANKVGEDDPYEIPKTLGIYKKVSVNCDVTTSGLIKRVYENKMKIAEATKKKKDKLENYYKTMDKNIKEN